MSERVTWEVCPRCGGVAAVGWPAVPGEGSGPCGSGPVEFDCPIGCLVDLEVLARIYRLLRRIPSEAASESGDELS